MNVSLWFRLIRSNPSERKSIVSLHAPHPACSDGIWMYQMTDKGLALEITAKGTKYSKDDDLNKS
jgi:hypothetical protein